MPVLVETKNEKGLYEGHAPNYTVVETSGSPSILKQIVSVKIKGYDNGVLFGDII
jgi:tRNA A37 methylthiotransferase MiaB